jgi:hypothetical protein
MLLRNPQRTIERERRTNKKKRREKKRKDINEEGNTETRDTHQEKKLLQHIDVLDENEERIVTESLPATEKTLKSLTKREVRQGDLKTPCSLLPDLAEDRRRDAYGHKREAHRRRTYKHRGREVPRPVPESADGRAAMPAATTLSRRQSQTSTHRDTQTHMNVPGLDALDQCLKAQTAARPCLLQQHYLVTNRTVRHSVLHFITALQQLERLRKEGK